MQRSLALAAAAFTTLVPAGGWATPFNFTPEAFQRWLNANPERWQEGRRVTFSNLSRCSAARTYPEAYSCSQGFVRISDPMGTRVCNLLGVSWRAVDPGEERKLRETYGSAWEFVPIQRQTPGASYRKGECRWQ